MRHAKRVDRNHGEIRDGLRALGYDVLDLSGAGDGIPDLCVKINAVGGIPKLQPHTPPVFLEVKDGSKPPSARKLTTKQEEWSRFCWAITHKVCNLEEAKDALSWASKAKL